MKKYGKSLALLLSVILCLSPCRQHPGRQRPRCR